MKEFVSILLVLVLVNLAVAVPGLAEERPLVNPKLIGRAFPPQAPAAAPAPAAKPSGGTQWTKGGKVMTVIGLAMVGSGAVMMTRKNSDGYSTGLEVNWKATGGLWMAGGAVLTLIGLTRRH